MSEAVDLRVDVGDAALFVHREGSGVPMVVLHGGMGVDQQYLRRPLAAVGDAADMIFVDQRGNGLSPADLTGVTLETWADDIPRVLDACELDRAVVFGHSYGGRVALLTALRHPDRISGLILCATSAAQVPLTVIREGVERRQPSAEQLRGFSTEPFADDADFERWMRMAFPLYLAPDSRISYDDLFGGTRISWTAAWRGSVELERHDFHDQLHRIAAPTLVLTGRHDLATPVVEAAEPLAGHLADAELRIFERSGHYPFAEEPEDFLATMRTWLAREGTR